MHAILVTDENKLMWTEVPGPERRENEIIIDIRAAALNRADLLQRDGNYPPPTGWPEWMGLEASGVVADAPSGSRWKTGDRVCALLGGGGYAEQVAVPEYMVLPIPSDLSFTEGAALPEALATSYLNLCIEGELTAGETAFIQAGASGLGTVAIQLAKLLGAKVVTTVGSEEKAALVRQLGADVVINRKREDIAAVLADHHPDVALDCVAGPDLSRCLETMARGGRWIVIAALGGISSELDMGDFFKRGIRLIGSTLRNRPGEMKKRIFSELEERVWDHLDSGDLKPVIYRDLPISQAEEAHAILRRNENLGKVVLTV